MEVLVIGGCGFIGSHVVDLLKTEGHNVRIATRNIKNTVPGTYYVPKWGDPRCEYIDMCLDALDGVDAVIHLGCSSVPSSSINDPVSDIQDNVFTTIHLLELMRMKKVKNLVYMSSGGAIYGGGFNKIMSEDDPQYPYSSYGIVKSTCEKYILMEARLHGLFPTILRPSNVYGPRQKAGAQGIIGNFLWNIANDKPCEIFGDGNIIRDYVYVDDVARACLKALSGNSDFGRSSGIYNISSGVGHSINDLLPMIGNVVGKPVSFVYRDGRNFDIKRVVLSNDKALYGFDWRPKIDLKEGLQKTWQWIQENNK